MNNSTNLPQVGEKDPRQAGDLLPMVYAELRRLAAAKLANEKAAYTLQPTALVHEAWLRLSRNGQLTWEGRTHFFGAAAEAMRRILIENARRKGAEKNGGGLQRAELEDCGASVNSNADTLLAINEALEALAKEDALLAEVVKLRFFIGLNNMEIGEVMGISERTVKRHWAFARAWLYDHLSRAD